MASNNAGYTFRSAPTWESQSLPPLAPGVDVPIPGAVPGADGSFWFYSSVPLTAVIDAQTTQESTAAGMPIFNAANELVALEKIRVNNRRISRNLYREIHLLLINVPTWFEALDQPTAPYLNRVFANELVNRRLLLFGAKLQSTVGQGGIRSFVDSVVEAFNGLGTPMTDYARDFEDVSAAMVRSGLKPITPSEYRFANAWWNHGDDAATPVIAHTDHQHYFQSSAGARRVKKADPELLDCENWPEVPQGSITFGSVQKLELGSSATGVPIEDPFGWWAPKLVNAGAAAISIRGLLEPSQITAAEMKTQASRVDGDSNEALQKGQTQNANVKKQADALQDFQELYERGEAPHTLHDASIIVAFNGARDDLARAVPGVRLNLMTNLQPNAWHETMLCSSIRSNPHRHDHPLTTIAFSGLPNITRVGDSDGALLGFTEDDRVPVWVSPRAASTGDAAPLLMVPARTRAGKTLLAQWIAMQFAKLGHPQVFINPKPESDLSDAFDEVDDKAIVTLNDFASADGMLDPLRVAASKESGIDMAGDMLANVNPWGSLELRARAEPLIRQAIRYGVDRGATATGQALRIAEQQNVIDREVTAPIWATLAGTPMFSTLLGMNPASDGLRVSTGLTLFQVGDNSFRLPDLSNNVPYEQQSISQRLSANIIRMLISGSMAALRNRGGGVVHVDEAWVAEKAAPDALEEIGRMAASADVLPILYNQTPATSVAHGMSGYISRGLIGHLNDPVQSKAAVDLFRITNPHIEERIRLPRDFGGAPVRDSLLAQNVDDPITGARVNVRGSIFYFYDLVGRLAPVEVKLPKEFLWLASTSPQDVAARRAQKAALSA